MAEEETGPSNQPIAQGSIIVGSEGSRGHRAKNGSFDMPQAPEGVVVKAHGSKGNRRGFLCSGSLNVPVTYETREDGFYATCPGCNKTLKLWVRHLKRGTVISQFGHYVITLTQKKE